MVLSSRSTLLVRGWGSGWTNSRTMTARIELEIFVVGYRRVLVRTVVGDRCLLSTPTAKLENFSGETGRPTSVDTTTQRFLRIPRGSDRASNVWLRPREVSGRQYSADSVMND